MRFCMCSVRIAPFAVGGGGGGGGGGSPFSASTFSDEIGEFFMAPSAILAKELLIVSNF